MLKSIPQKSVSSKLNLKYHGPFHCTLCRDNYLFQVEDLLNGKKIRFMTVDLSAFVTAISSYLMSYRSI